MQLDFVNFRGTGSVRDAVPSEHSVYQVDFIRKTGPNDETIREWAVECGSCQEIIEIFRGKSHTACREAMVEKEDSEARPEASGTAGLLFSPETDLIHCML